MYLFISEVAMSSISNFDQLIALRPCSIPNAKSGLVTYYQLQLSYSYDNKEFLKPLAAPHFFFFFLTSVGGEGGHTHLTRGVDTNQHPSSQFLLLQMLLQYMSEPYLCD